MKAKQQRTRNDGYVNLPVSSDVILLCICISKHSSVLFRYIFEELVAEPWTSHMLGKCSVTETHLHPFSLFFFFTLFSDSFTESPRVALNLQSFCFSLLSTWDFRTLPLYLVYNFKKIKESSMSLATWAQRQNPWPLSLRILATESVMDACTYGFTG